MDKKLSEWERSFKGDTAFLVLIRSCVNSYPSLTDDNRLGMIFFLQLREIGWCSGRCPEVVREVKIAIGVKESERDTHR